MPAQPITIGQPAKASRAERSSDSSASRAPARSSSRSETRTVSLALIQRLSYGFDGKIPRQNTPFPLYRQYCAVCSTLDRQKRRLPTPFHKRCAVAPDSPIAFTETLRPTTMSPIRLHGARAQVCLWGFGPGRPLTIESIPTGSPTIAPKKMAIYAKKQVWVVAHDIGKESRKDCGFWCLLADLLCVR